ncbi:unnamed protein product [Vitrella brassicaformis CCMP3155]|uniref:RING-type domain-containing protein n=1 Tax=Vitrella brassicaformis (strain CCMP3155) TaxID=1169540 RepID=A0A0G4FLT1_VITBC|nr:unnamed protein product [Vitrella brassicaformis CCMP3155]|eukprot:CEM14977.1 unnamed protein product [Vitrella brassicaformis CCMP3155]
MAKARCTICYEALLGDDDNPPYAANPECGHVFHRNCLHNWESQRQHPTCPGCRKPLQPFRVHIEYDMKRRKPRAAPAESAQPAAKGGDSSGEEDDERIEELEAENERLQKRVGALGKEKAAAQKEVEAAAQKLHSREKLLSNLQKDKQKLVDQNRELYGEKAHATTRLLEAETELIEWKDRAKRAEIYETSTNEQQYYAAVKQYNGDLQALLRGLMTKEKDNRCKVKRVERERDEAGQAQQTANERAERLEKEVERAQTKEGAAINENKRLKKLLREARQKLKAATDAGAAAAAAAASDASGQQKRPADGDDGGVGEEEEEDIFGDAILRPPKKKAKDDRRVPGAGKVFPLSRQQSNMDDRPAPARPPLRPAPPRIVPVERPILPTGPAGETLVNGRRDEVGEPEPHAPGAAAAAAADPQPQPPGQHPPRPPVMPKAPKAAAPAPQDAQPKPHRQVPVTPADGNAGDGAGADGAAASRPVPQPERVEIVIDDDTPEGSKKGRGKVVGGKAVIKDIGGKGQHGKAKGRGGAGIGVGGGIKGREKHIAGQSSMLAFLNGGGRGKK